MGLSRRLKAICNLIEECDLIADIGTDHAYIPIELVKTKKVKAAIATDIVEGPLAIARENVRLEGLEEKIEVFQSDGLANYKESNLKVDYYIIAGMGANTMIEILSGYLKSKKEDVDAHCAKETKFILQPMTGKHELRKWLVDNCFEIIREKAVSEGDKFYNILVVKYHMNVDLNMFELYFGKNPIEDEEYYEYLRFELKKALSILSKLKHAKEPDLEKCEIIKKTVDALEKKLLYSLK